MGRYVVAYHEQLAQVVADERYLQVAPQLPLGNPERTRSLRSEVILVRPEGSATYKLFRDVVEVNGRRVRDREDRLAELFFSSPATLDRIAAESSAATTSAPSSATSTCPPPCCTSSSQPTRPIFASRRPARRRWMASGHHVPLVTETAQPTLVRFNY